MFSQGFYRIRASGTYNIELRSYFDQIHSQSYVKSIRLASDMWLYSIGISFEEKRKLHELSEFKVIKAKTELQLRQVLKQSKRIET